MKTKRTTLRIGSGLRGIALGAATIVALASSPALAIDGKELPGSACRTSSSGLPYSIDSLGRIANPLVGLSTFVCPVVRDSIGFNVADGKVWVVDSNPAQNFICTLAMQNPSSPGAGFLSVASSGGASAVPQVLDFAPLPSVANGYLNVTCSVPGVSGGRASRLVAYRVDEQP